ncbi:cytochrome P450 [Neptuniibacter sp. CAU 1671]|uniref:cytochrome P450 n=1 Tax=Neptuniibacter sp. CAU 1671 TaxID=3032593 RepID=UPI0023DC8837|nr:cytochrome P450 [Neptuniibacter sp. CAU 1671]MDF2180647.1 cytochrome P450 [Neptuniibacter sp. CAU 1671]
MQKDYLAEFDAAPEAEKYPLVKQWMASEPLPFFAQLRAQRPILVTPECTLVALFSDIRDALSMPGIFTVDLYKPKMGVTETDVGYLMAHDDDALHTREKNLMKGFLNRDDLPRVRQLVSDTCAEVLATAGGHIELVNQYSRIVPTVLVQEYFGLDGVDPQDLIRWSYWNQADAFYNQPFDLLPEEEFQRIIAEHDKVSKELVAYIAKLMARKLAWVKAEQAKNLLLIGWYGLKSLVRHLLGKPSERLKDDIVTRMLRSSMAKEVDFGLVRVGVNAGGLLIGAVETTSQAVTQVVAFFLDRPDLLAKAKLAATLEDPREFDAYVWEALRFVPISPFSFRKLSCDYALAKGTAHETLIPQGTNVLLLTQSAMFDTYAYDHPEKFIPGRNGYHHFNFGYGPHECLGKYVGMEMIPEMVRHVLLLDNLKPLSVMDYKGTHFPEHFALCWQ